MLPLLRLLPVGGVVLAILFLILALTPPDGATPALHRVALEARGPLQDRKEHPEWRQFFIMAAFRRAEAVTKLRDLPSAPTKLPEIVMPVPPAPPITIRAAATSVPSAQKMAALAPAPPSKPAYVAALSVAPAETAPSPAIEEKAAQVASLPVPAIEAPPITITPAPAPEQTAPLISAADVRLPEPSVGSARIAVPLPTAAPPKLRKVAGLPIERSLTGPAAEEMTGSMDAHPGATIPIEIGETSSTELPIVLPRERPPVLRKPKPLTRAKRRTKPQAKPQPRPYKQMGLLDVWLSRNQSTASPTASPAAQPDRQMQVQTGQ